MERLFRCRYVVQPPRHAHAGQLLPCSGQLLSVSDAVHPCPILDTCSKMCISVSDPAQMHSGAAALEIFQSAYGPRPSCRYKDPLTGQPYATLEAFKQLRER